MPTPLCVPYVVVVAIVLIYLLFTYTWRGGILDDDDVPGDGEQTSGFTVRHHARITHAD
jgi:hypothetical protein